MRQTRLRIALLVVGLAILIAGCNPAGTPPEDEQTGVPARVVPVEVTQVETGNIASTLAFTGDMQPTDSLVLVSVVSGAVEEVYIDVGDQVRTGDPILQVVQTTFRAQLKQAQSALAIAQLNKSRIENGPRSEQVAMAEAGLAVAQANLRKLENGPRSEQVAIAEAGLDGARAQLGSILTVTEDERILAAANLAQAEAGLRLAQAEYDKIKWAGQVGLTPQALQLQQASIGYETALASYNRQVNPDSSDIAPLEAGIRQAESSLALTQNPFQEEDFVLAKAGVQQAEAQLSMTRNPFVDEDIAQAEAGIQQAEAAVALTQFQLDNAILRAPFDGIVSEVHATTGSIASPQSPAITLISKGLEIQIEIPESQIANLYVGQPAAVKVAAYPGLDFAALVTKIAPTADTTSHTFPVTVTPADEDAKLMAGMFAEITLLSEERTNVVLVPRSAVTTVDGQDVVYILSEDESTARLRPVVLGLSDTDRIELIEGISVGETIVTAGLSNLSDGVNVEITARVE